MVNYLNDFHFINVNFLVKILLFYWYILLYYKVHLRVKLKKHLIIQFKKV